LKTQIKNREYLRFLRPTNAERIIDKVSHQKGSCSRLDKEPGQIPHAMKDAHDHNDLAACLVRREPFLCSP
jgi:hypothetical protein